MVSTNVRAQEQCLSTLSHITSSTNVMTQFIEITDWLIKPVCHYTKVHVSILFDVN